MKELSWFHAWMIPYYKSSGKIPRISFEHTVCGWLWYGIKKCYDGERNERFN